MIKRKLSTLIALLLACVMLIPATAFAYASDGGDAAEGVKCDRGACGLYTCLHLCIKRQQYMDPE